MFICLYKYCLQWSVAGQCTFKCQYSPSSNLDFLVFWDSWRQCISSSSEQKRFCSFMWGCLSQRIFSVLDSQSHWALFLWNPLGEKASYLACLKKWKSSETSHWFSIFVYSQRSDFWKDSCTNQLCLRIMFLSMISVINSFARIYFGICPFLVSGHFKGLILLVLSMEECNHMN